MGHLTEHAGSAADARAPRRIGTFLLPARRVVCGTGVALDNDTAKPDCSRSNLNDMAR